MNSIVYNQIMSIIFNIQSIKEKIIDSPDSEELIKTKNKLEDELYALIMTK